MSEFYGTGLEQLRDEYGYDPRSGDVVVKRWIGSPDQIQQQALIARSYGLRYDVSEEDEGGCQILRVTYQAGGDNPDPNTALADLWSLVGNQLEKSLWELDKVQDQFDGWTTQDMADFKNDVDSVLAGTLDVASVIAGLPVGTDTTVIEGLIKSLARGVESKSVSSYVLRRVIIVAANTNIRPAYTGVNKVISTANLQAGSDPSATTIPSTLLFTLPSGYWLKQSPTVEQQSSGTWSITQEWWHADKYDSFVYDTYP